MRHEYQVKDKLNRGYSLLKGRDATVYEGLCTLGFEPILYLNYRCEDPEDEGPDTFLLDRVFRFDGYSYRSKSVCELMQQLHGIMVPSE